MPKPTTALITGASSGIGWELAQLFAADGHNLVLVARREDRLQQLANELRERHRIAVDVIAADLSLPQAAQHLVDDLQQRGRHIDILVNNAGFGLHGAFADAPLARWQQMLQLNINAVMELSYLLLPGMRAQGFGRIANLSSVAAFQSTPSFAVYAATKGFVLMFSEALREEVASDGISVTAICPGATETEFHEVAKHRNTQFLRFTADAASVARESYRAIAAGHGTVVTGWMNKPVPQSLRFTPRAWAVKISGWMAKPMDA